MFFQLTALLSPLLLVSFPNNNHSHLNKLYYRFPIIRWLLWQSDWWNNGHERQTTKYHHNQSRHFLILLYYQCPGGWLVRLKSKSFLDSLRVLQGRLGLFHHRLARGWSFLHLHQKIERHPKRYEFLFRESLDVHPIIQLK